MRKRAVSCCGWPAAGACELIDVERRAVRREEAVRLRRASEIRERLRLQRHVLEHRFDDDVDVAEVGVTRHRRDEAHRLLEGVRRHATFGHRRLIVRANRRNAAVERGVKGGQGILVLDRAPGTADGPGTKADGGNFPTCPAKFAILHRDL